MINFLSKLTSMQKGFVLSLGEAKTRKARSVYYHTAKMRKKSVSLEVRMEMFKRMENPKCVLKLLSQNPFHAWIWVSVSTICKRGLWYMERCIIHNRLIRTTIVHSPEIHLTVCVDCLLRIHLVTDGRVFLILLFILWHTLTLPDVITTL